MRLLFVLAAGCGLVAGGAGCHLAGKCDCDRTTTYSCEYGGGNCCQTPIAATPIAPIARPPEQLPAPPKLAPITPDK